jgi:uncharacterized protein YdaT
MKYSRRNYPDRMRHMRPEQRQRAIKYLNKLIEKNKAFDSNYLVSLAIKQAIDDDQLNYDNENPKAHGNKYSVRHRNEKWAVECSKHSNVSYLFNSKHEAIKAAKQLAHENHAQVMIVEDEE